MSTHLSSPFPPAAPTLPLVPFTCHLTSYLTPPFHPPPDPPACLSFFSASLPLLTTFPASPHLYPSTPLSSRTIPLAVSPLRSFHMSHQTSHLPLHYPPNQLSILPIEGPSCVPSDLPLGPNPLIQATPPLSSTLPPTQHICLSTFHHTRHLFHLPLNLSHLHLYIQQNFSQKEYKRSPSLPV